MAGLRGYVQLNIHTYINMYTVCVCVFSSHPFWTSSSSLDVPAGVTQEEGHTGFLSTKVDLLYF